jgi:hypothetical protein
MYEHRDLWMCPDNRAGGARVIQVNVGQQNVADVIPSDAMRLQTLFERGETRGRARIDDGDT